MKHITTFNPYVYTVKSVYRKKLRDSTIKVSLRVFEEDKKFIFNIKDTNEYKFLKKGAIITVNIGDNKYIYIEEGNMTQYNKAVNLLISLLNNI